MRGERPWIQPPRWGGREWHKLDPPSTNILINLDEPWRRKTACEGRLLHFLFPFQWKPWRLLNSDCTAAIQAFSSSTDPEMKIIIKEESLVPSGGLSYGHYDRLNQNAAHFSTVMDGLAIGSFPNGPPVKTKFNIGLNIYLREKNYIFKIFLGNWFTFYSK